MNNFESLIYFAPEWVLVGLVLVLLILEIFSKNLSHAGAGTVTFVGALFYLGANLLAWKYPALSLFEGMIVLDPLSVFFKAIAALALLAVVALSHRSRELDRAHPATYYMLLVATTLGMDLLIVANHLLMIYLSLEMVSIPSYLLAGSLKGERRSSEAALKYVVYGGVASGVMVYGLSWIYGLTGSLLLPEIYQFLSSVPVDSTTLFVAIVMSLAGFFYKTASVPFHMWSPDVYEGSPTPVTAFFSVGPKAAGFAVMIRFLFAGVSYHIAWSEIIGFVAIATMTWGNLAALRQMNMKRLLAYSSIAHAGYILMGLAADSPRALHSVLFYLVVYALMNLGAFLVVIMIQNQSGQESLGAYKGLGRRGTQGAWLAVMMTIFLFSLTGIPPLAGFIGKFYLFAAVIEAKLYGLALMGVINSVIALYYYARVVKVMFLEEPTAAETFASPARGHWALAGVFSVLLLYLGLFWNPLAELAVAASQLMG